MYLHYFQHAVKIFYHYTYVTYFELIIYGGKRKRDIEDKFQTDVVHGGIHYYWYGLLDWKS